MKDLIEALKSYKKELVDAGGFICYIDGIECYGICGVLEKIYFLDKIIYRGIGKAVFVDKNHDLSYYIYNNDYKDSRDPTNGKFSYEWGGYKISTAKTLTLPGYGLYNTNNLLELNLIPGADAEFTVWDKIREFRKNYSNNWFLPSKDELNLIYEARKNLNNLSMNEVPWYWSSSENTSFTAWRQNFESGFKDNGNKSHTLTRARLCVRY